LNIITRRTALAAGAAAIGSTVLPNFAMSAIPVASATPPKLPIEAGATLRVLRPTKFLDPDEAIFRENVAKFTAQTGVPVRVDFVGWEDLRPQVGVAANTGAGPDVVVAWPDDPHLFADKLVELSDIAEYLGTKYGGWYYLAEKYGKRWGTNNWIGIPMGGTGGPLVYRKSWVKEAGFDKIPTDHVGFLKLCQNLKKIGHPAGFALGNAVGDANAYANWLLWSHGGILVDENNKVSINRKETIEALKFAKDLYPTFISGVLSWQDPSNNKAFIAGDIGVTQNGVSIYYALKNDPKTAEMAADTDHAPMPLGVSRTRPESALLLNTMVFKHTKYPNAAKEWIRFMMEQEQYEKWLTGCIGYWSQPLKAYSQAAVWESDPKIAVYRETCDMQYWNGFKGPISQASGAATADYVLVQMFAAVSSGQATPEDAVREAERRARRFYR
jgi:multiple sugar transport system substrate-binding protein